MDRKDPAAGTRERSLLSIGDALRDVAPPVPSRLQRALSEARANLADRDRDPHPRLDEEWAGSRRPSPATEPSPSIAKHEVPVDPAPQPALAPAPQGRAASAPKDMAFDAPRPEAPIRDAVEPTKRLIETPPPAPAAVVASPVIAAPPIPPVPPVSTPSDGRWEPLIDPAAVVRGMWRSKRIIAACTIAGAAIGVLVALSTPKTYESVAELLADPRNLNLVDRELTQPGISNEATLAIVDNQVRILKSGVVLNNVVKRLNLEADPEFNGTASSGGVGGLISGLRSLLSRSDGADDPARRQALAVRNLAEALDVSRGGRTFVISLGVTTNDPEKSALIANTTAEVFLQQYGHIQSQTAGRAAGELSAKLDELRAAVEEAERRVETFKAEHDLIDAQGRLITDDEIVKLNEQLSVARAKTLELNARAASAREIKADDVVNGVLPEAISSPTIQDLRRQYAEVKGEIDRLSVRLGPRHPQLLALQAQLSGLRGQIETEIRRLVASTQTDLKRAVQLEQELSSRLAQLKVRQGDVSSELVTLRELERDASSKRTVYEQFLLRSRETGEQQGINSANISLITPATAPLEPNSPSRTMTVIASTALGFLVGVMIGGLRGAWDGFRGNPRAHPTGPGVPSLRRRRTTMFDEVVPSSAPPAEGAVVSNADKVGAPQSRQPEPDTSSGAGITAEPESRVPPHKPLSDEEAAAAQSASAPFSHGVNPARSPSSQSDHPHSFHPGSSGPDWSRHSVSASRPVRPAESTYGWQREQDVPDYPATRPLRPSQPPGPTPTRADPLRPEPQLARYPEDKPGDLPSDIEEIRASVRECREAIRELAEKRAYRRYF